METNQIAAAVQCGEADLLELWEAVRLFAHNRAYHWLMATEGRAGMVLEDFMQVAFLAVIDALEGWEPDKGSFITWYSLRLKNAFAEAAGQRTQRDKRDPLQNCVSLDISITDSEGDPLFLGDVLPDQTAEQDIEDIAERDCLQHLHSALSRALLTLSTQQRQAVVLRHCYGLTLDETATKIGSTRAIVKTAEQKGLRILRHPDNSRELLPYIE